MKVANVLFVCPKIKASSSQTFLLLAIRRERKNLGIAHGKLKRNQDDMTKNMLKAHKTHTHLHRNWATDIDSIFLKSPSFCLKPTRKMLTN